MNKSFDGGIFPDIWKRASVVPIFKKGNKSLLSYIGKLQERIVFKNMHLISYLII